MIWRRLSDVEREEIVRLVAADPTAGDVMQGTGGARKVRLAGRSKSKSGGYRVITYYVASDVPVFLFDIYGKDERANLSKAQRNTLSAILGQIARVYRAGSAAKTRR